MNYVTSPDVPFDVVSNRTAENSVLKSRSPGRERNGYLNKNLEEFDVQICSPEYTYLRESNAQDNRRVVNTNEKAIKMSSVDIRKKEQSRL